MLNIYYLNNNAVQDIQQCIKLGRYKWVECTYSHLWPSDRQFLFIG